MNVEVQIFLWFEDFQANKNIVSIYHLLHFFCLRYIMYIVPQSATMASKYQTALKMF